MKCHAGCDWKAILASLSLPARHLYTPPPVTAAAYAKAYCPQITFPELVRHAGRSLKADGYHLAAIHDYGPDHRVMRHRKGSKKEMVWESRPPPRAPGYLDCSGTPTESLPIYREKDIQKAVAMGETVLIGGVQSSVDALKGWYATTWAGGAKSVKVDALLGVLAGYDRIVVIPDHDLPGMRPPRS